MLASCVHHLLLDLGTVLGISGFFHSSVAQLLLRGRSRAPVASNSDSESNSEKQKQSRARNRSDDTARKTASLFSAGLIAGGILLGIWSERLQHGLGIPIFDPLLQGAEEGDGLRKVVRTAVVGLLVGAGTKVG